MILSGRRVLNGCDPFIVAEIGAAHNGKLDQALQLIEQAAKVGANAVKIQALAADTITIESTASGFVIAEGPWAGRSLYELYTETAIPRGWYPALFDRARLLNIPLFASVFSHEDLRWMEEFSCPFYKIASCEIVDLDLIRAVAAIGKPVIMSTGMASRREIVDAIGVFRAGGGNRDNLAFLHCVSAYPARFDQMSMHLVLDMAREFKVPVGLSDHTLGIVAPVVATALGAAMIEKHITLDRADDGPDDGFASEPAEFQTMVTAVRRAYQCMAVRTSSGEGATRPLRRSLYVFKDMKAGERFTRDNVRSIRPGNGLPCSQLPTVLAATVARDVERGTPLSWDLVKR